jgi:putative flippase GtrA
MVQFAKFVAVGLLNTGFAYGLYAALLYVGFGYVVANLTALVIGILVSFVTQGRLVFANREAGRLVRFVAVWILIYFVSIFLISRFIALGFNAYVSGALALPFSTLLSFVAQKFFVFQPIRDAKS